MQHGAPKCRSLCCCVMLSCSRGCDDDMRILLSVASARVSCEQNKDNQADFANLTCLHVSVQLASCCVLLPALGWKTSVEGAIVCYH